VVLAEAEEAHQEAEVQDGVGKVTHRRSTRCVNKQVKWIKLKKLVLANVTIIME
jgi:hypothetical protein